MFASPPLRCMQRCLTSYFSPSPSVFCPLLRFQSLANEDLAGAEVTELVAGSEQSSTERPGPTRRSILQIPRQPANPPTSAAAAVVPKRALKFGKAILVAASPLWCAGCCRRQPNSKDSFPDLGI